jgi:hypothetical protein
MIRYFIGIQIVCDYPGCFAAGKFYGKTRISAVDEAQKKGWSVFPRNDCRVRCPEHKGKHAAKGIREMSSV